MLLRDIPCNRRAVPMRTAHLTFAACLLVAGCDSLKSVKYDNPVLGPPPPRVQMSANGQPQRLDSRSFPQVETSDIQQASLSLNGLTPGLSLADSQTVAVVNGSPVLAAEVLERYSPQLAAAEKDLAPADFNRARLALIKKDLPGHIERKLLAQAMMSQLKAEQLAMIDGLVDEQFEKQLAVMTKEAKVGSRVELEQILREQGTTLANLKVNFANQQMAQEFLGAKANSKQKIGRPDMLAYYQQHRDDYLQLAEVRWQQILIDKRKHGDSGAEARLQEIVAALRPTRGANFSEVAKKFSDGPNATAGGEWDWTKKGSLADRRVDEALFELPLGQPSQVFRSDDALKILLVNQRRDETYTSFAEVQDEIEEKLQADLRRAAARKVIDELRASADIITVFDSNSEKERVTIGEDPDSMFR